MDQEVKKFVELKLKERHVVSYEGRISPEVTANEIVNWIYEYTVIAIASIPNLDKANLGMAKTSELIYELSARCDTGSINRGGDYRTVDKGDIRYCDKCHRYKGDELTLKTDKHT